jgi:micrococcal nuclease
MTLRLAVVCVLAGSASTATGQTVEDQIRTEVGRYVTAINSGDSRTVAALYVNDPRTSSVGDGDIHRGWQRIADLLRNVYEQAGSVRMTADHVDVMTLGNDAAVAVLQHHWAVGDPHARPFIGAMTLVYTRTPQGWRVAHDHTSTLQPRPSPVTAFRAIIDSGPRSPRRETSSCTVTRIVDGDTIDCARVGRVRLIGMDAPESNQRPFGGQATKALASLVRVGAEVRLEPDVEARDRYGRLLAYVWLGDVMVNWRMVREGWAVLLTYQPNVQYVEWFVDAERRAREEGRALWSTGGFDCRPADRRAKRCE